MKKQLLIEIPELNWFIVGKYTYRSAKLSHVVCSLSKYQVQPLIDKLSESNQLDNHIIVVIQDNDENTFAVSISDGNYKLGRYVVEQSW